MESSSHAHTEARRCDECGAAPRENDVKYCSYCGAELPPEAVAPAPPTAREATKARFVALEAHPRTARLLAKPPSARRHVAKASATATTSIVVAVGVVLFAIMFMKTSSEMRSNRFPSGVSGFGAFDGFGPAQSVAQGIGIMHVLIPLAVIGTVIFFATRRASHAAKLSSSPTRSRLALVVDEQQHVESYGDRTRTIYRITFESPSGSRTTFDATGQEAATLTKGDMGVVHSRSTQLIGFSRIDV